MKPTDDEQTIKQAYKKSALRYHPDKCKDLTEEEATAKFQSVANALKVPIAPKQPTPVSSVSKTDDGALPAYYQVLERYRTLGIDGDDDNDDISAHFPFGLTPPCDLVSMALSSKARLEQAAAG